MNKLTKILLREASTLIPFSCVMPKICSEWLGEGDKSKPLKDFSFNQKANLLRRMIFNAGFSIFGSIYVIGALYHGANPLSPKDYLEKVKIYNEKQEQIQNQNKKIIP